MYDSADPRSMLKGNESRPRIEGVPITDSHGLFYEEEPAEDDENGRSWYCRGQNFIVHYADAKPGARFTRNGQPDEYVIILPDAGTPFEARANGEAVNGAGSTIIMMPPGGSEIHLPLGGRMARLVTSLSSDLAAKCSNANTYREPDPSVPPFAAWPEPFDGFMIRAYPLDVPEVKGRLGRIYRCSTFMINLPGPYGPRDITKVSPHRHEDFEQGSLVLAGIVSHHLRWPWHTNMSAWRNDVHIRVRAPSLAVIPANVTHTSVGWAEGDNQLADIFCPPRIDFSLQEGWVLNAEEYPLPDVSQQDLVGLQLPASGGRQGNSP